MTKKLNPNEAPHGYVAVESMTCAGCAFRPDAGGCSASDKTGCSKSTRRDGNTVIFVKRATDGTQLDARYTLRLPAAVKAKAQRIGGAAVIAAIEAVKE